MTDRPLRWGRAKTRWIIFASVSVVAVIAIAIASDIAIKTIVARRAQPTLTDTRSDATKREIDAAVAFADSGDVASAYSVIDAAVGKDGISNSDRSSLYQTKATIAVNADQKDIAIDAQNSAIKSDPQNWQLVEGLSDIYATFHDTTNAVKYQDRAASMRGSATSTHDEDLN